VRSTARERAFAVSGFPRRSRNAITPDMKTWLMAVASLVGTAMLSALSWTPDGERILDVTGEYPAGREVFTVNADGSGRRWLTSNGLGHEYPTLSPDGKTILFSSYRSGQWKFYVMNADGTGERDLGMAPTSADLNDPARAEWSPDGTQFVFPLTREGRRFLHLARADGSDVREIPNGRGIYPHWSRDGRSLVFFSQNNLHSINLDGTDRRQLTRNQSTADADRPNYPQWSADGAHVYFLRGHDIFRINRDGTGEILIPSLPGQKWYLGLSSKGKLAFGTVENKRDCLHTLDADGRNLRHITN
jgi:Tol biopolymer transport system component